jgi:O-antigen ligase
MFLLGSLAFTYSRASYLAFMVGAVFIGIYKRKIRLVAFIVLALLTAIILLPTSGNRILRFTRSFSAIARIANYKTTFEIFSKSPVFGVGYNNLCIAYQKYVGPQKFSSHSCSGSDSSLLFILATTGIVGLIAFAYMLLKIPGFLLSDSNSRILISSFAALLVHSIFSNSMFYPWVMGWMMILLGVSLRSKVES